MIFLWDICDLGNPHGLLKVKYIACLFLLCTSCVFLGVVTCHRHLTIPWGYLPFADELDDPTEVCTAVLKDPLEQLGSSIGWISDGLEPGNATVLLGGWIHTNANCSWYLCVCYYICSIYLLNVLWLVSWLFDTCIIIMHSYLHIICIVLIVFSHHCYYILSLDYLLYSESLHIGCPPQNAFATFASQKDIRKA